MLKESCGIPYFFFKLLNFLSSLNEMRSLYFDALDSPLDFAYVERVETKKAFSVVV